MNNNRSITPNDPADFTPAMGNYKTLQPFRYWCQKVLPLVYDDSLSYYELLCKVVDYINKTMEDVETLHSDVVNLHGAYEELQKYVNDYFDTLDIQEEINNKLDKMASDGTLLTIMIPSISTETAKWLSKNITNPTNPVIDKSLTVSGAAADASVTGKYSNKLASGANFSSLSVTYTHDSNSITFTVNCGTTGFLFTTYDLYGARDINGKSATTKLTSPWNGGTFIIAYRPTDKTLHAYILTQAIAPITDIIIYSVALGSDFSILTIPYSVMPTYYTSLSSKFNAANAWVTGKYSDKLALGANFSSLSVTYTHDSDSITFTVNCGTTGFLFTTYDLYGARDINGKSATTKLTSPWNGGTFIIAYRPTDKTLHAYILTQAIAPITDIIIYSVALGSDFSILTIPYSVMPEKVNIPLSTKNLGDNTFSIFNSAVCCGDSYTSGYIKTDKQTSETNEKYSWVKYLSTITGCNCINCGSSGANVLTWQTAERGLPKAKASGLTQCYLLGLGLNDSSGTDRGVTVGSASDIGTNNQTYYGGLSKIIRELHNISPNSFIFCFTMPFETGAIAPYNNAIKTICELYKNTYNTYMVDLRKYKEYYNQKSVSNNAVNYHYTPAGYQQLAEITCKALSDCINANYSDFYNVNMIET